jgi:hypothetical protein
MDIGRLHSLGFVHRVAVRAQRTALADGRRA